MVSDMPSITTTDGKLDNVQVGFIVNAIRSLLRAVNGRLRFGDGTHSSQSGNIDGHTKTVYFADANTDNEVPHGLDRVPIGIIVLYVDTDGAVVRGASEGSWNKSRMLVRCNVAGATARFVVV